MHVIMESLELTSYLQYVAELDAIIVDVAGAQQSMGDGCVGLSPRNWSIWWSRERVANRWPQAKYLLLVCVGSQIRLPGEVVTP